MHGYTSVKTSIVRMLDTDSTTQKPIKIDDRLVESHEDCDNKPPKNGAQFVFSTQSDLKLKSSEISD